MGALVRLPNGPLVPSTNPPCSAIEFLTLVAWVVTFALLVEECQAWDAAEDAVEDVLTPEELASLNSLPGQDSAIMAMKAATWLSGSNSVFVFLTLIACSM